MNGCADGGANGMQDDFLKDREVEKRRDDALRRALTTPPKPKQESVKRKEPKSGASRSTRIKQQKPG
jgi:hypothetical protein